MSVFPQTTAAQRDPLYGDVETLLLPGFLTHPVVVQGTPLCLRTLGPGDMFGLKARMTAPSADWRVWTVASSIWMVNGISLLDEPGLIPRLADTVRTLPKNAQDILFTIVIGLFARQNRASTSVESYCYEIQSRYQWRSLKGANFPDHAGVPGVQRLGTNVVQRVWAAFNTYEDQREHDDTLWEGFKLSASAMSPKGIQKLDQKDKERRAKEEQRRQDVRDRFYYWALGIIDSPKSVEDYRKDSAGQREGSKTVEDLEEEMRRWVSGEEDWHDQVVREYKQNIVRRIESDKMERDKRLAALQAEAASRGEDLRPSTALVGYTPDQLSGLVGDRQEGSPGARRVSLGGGQQDYLYEKYLGSAPTPGKLKVDGDKLVVEGEESPTSLSKQIAQRQVTFAKGVE